MSDERVSKWDKALLQSIRQFAKEDEETQERVLLRISVYQKANLSGIIDRMNKTVEEVRRYDQLQIELMKRAKISKEDEKHERIHKRRRVED